MNYAVIDVGSNTIRLAVYRYTGRQLATIIGQKEIAGLAGYVKQGRLESDGIEKACTILRTFREIALRFVDEADIYVFATASLRGILNREQVLERIRRSCGLLPEVLPGEEEARLGFTGASYFAKHSDGVLIDIGGASTELVRFQNSRAIELVSMPIGCLNLYTNFVSQIIPRDKEWKRIKKEIRSHFEEYIPWENQGEFSLLIGVGGTVRAAHKLSCGLFAQPRERREMNAVYVKAILSELKNSESHIYHTIYKEIPERAQTISTGLMILHEAIKRFRCKKLFVSSFGLREGYLIDRVLKEEATGGDRNSDECGAIHAEQGTVMAEI